MREKLLCVATENTHTYFCKPVFINFSAVLFLCGCCKSPGFQLQKWDGFQQPVLGKKTSWQRGENAKTPSFLCDYLQWELSYLIKDPIVNLSLYNAIIINATAFNWDKWKIIKKFKKSCTEVINENRETPHKTFFIMIRWCLKQNHFMYVTFFNLFALSDKNICRKILTDILLLFTKWEKMRDSTRERKGDLVLKSNTNTWKMTVSFTVMHLRDLTTPWMQKYTDDSLVRYHMLLVHGSQKRLCSITCVLEN